MVLGRQRCCARPCLQLSPQTWMPSQPSSLPPAAAIPAPQTPTHSHAAGAAALVPLLTLAARTFPPHPAVVPSPEWPTSGSNAEPLTPSQTASHIVFSGSPEYLLRTSSPLALDGN